MIAFAIVSVSFPEGLILPVRISAVPRPPSIPPCQLYKRASGLISAIKLISIILPTFKTTAILSKPARTRRSISYSVSVRNQEPFVAELSLSSPAVRPMITRARSLEAAASFTML